MKKIILTALTLCLSASAAPAQKGKQTLFGDTWTGIVTAADFEKRELRLRSADETKPGTFDGVLVIHGGSSPASFGLGGAASIKFEGEGYRANVGMVTGFLLTPSGDGFEIVWREQFAISTDSATYQKGNFHPELEKHLRARLKK